MRLAARPNPCASGSSTSTRSRAPGTTSARSTRLLKDALEQVELADRVGFDYVWEVEHHFLEEYSHSSAPGGVPGRRQPAHEEHPARPRDRPAPADGQPPRSTGGRADRDARPRLRRAGRLRHGRGKLGRRARRLRDGPHPGSTPCGRTRSTRSRACSSRSRSRAGTESIFQMPPRNVVPKPIQKPHPPLWVACSRRETILFAARNGLGALTFSFVEPEDAGKPGSTSTTS